MMESSLVEVYDPNDVIGGLIGGKKRERGVKDT